MFYLEDDSEDEEKVHEGSLGKTEDVYRGKAPAGILVSYIHQCSGHLVCLLSLGNTGRRGKDTHQKKMANAFSLETIVS